MPTRQTLTPIQPTKPTEPTEPGNSDFFDESGMHRIPPAEEISKLQNDAILRLQATLGFKQRALQKLQSGEPLTLDEISILCDDLDLSEER